LSCGLELGDDLFNRDLIPGGPGHEFGVVTVCPIAEKAPHLIAWNPKFQRGAKAHEVDCDRLAIAPFCVGGMLNHVGIDGLLGNRDPVTTG
jgi:hypothetical protein